MMGIIMLLLLLLLLEREKELARQRELPFVGSLPQMPPTAGAESGCNREPGFQSRPPMSVQETGTQSLELCSVGSQSAC